MLNMFSGMQVVDKLHWYVQDGDMVRVGLFILNDFVFSFWYLDMTD